MPRIRPRQYISARFWSDKKKFGPLSIPAPAERLGSVASATGTDQQVARAAGPIHKEHFHAFYRSGQSVEGKRSRGHAQRAATYRYGQIQRGASEGGRDARRRGTSPNVEGRAGPVRREKSQSHRRALRRDQRA